MFAVAGEMRKRSVAGLGAVGARTALGGIVALGLIVGLGGVVSLAVLLGSALGRLGELAALGDLGDFSVEGLNEGTAYVVEFWATWCPPCVASIPHLTKLQKKHKNIVVMGVAGSERAGKEPLEAFVKKQGSKMAYTVAYDSDRSMSAAWMLSLIHI